MYMPLMKNATRGGTALAQRPAPFGSTTCLATCLVPVVILAGAACRPGGAGPSPALPTVVLSQSGQKRGPQPAPAMPGKNVPAIKVNTVGFESSWRKVAIFNLPPQQARVVDLQTGQVALTIAPEQVQARGIDAASQDPVWQVDLSALTRPGRYRLLGAGASSDPFVVGEQIYRPALAAGLKSFYFQRCRVPLLAPHAQWQGQRFERRQACHGHQEVGWDLAEHPRKGRRWELVGGWHDAGNFDMYVASTAVAAQTLLLAYQWAPAAFPDGQSHIPESGNGQPDLLDETRQALLWILSLQEPAGGVRHGEAAIAWSPEGPADADRSERWVGQVSSSATAKAVTVLAQAARLYADRDKAFAQRCRRGAEAGWRYLREHPQHVRAGRPGGGAQPLWDDEPGFTDVGARFGAAVAIWGLTGDAQALRSARGFMSSAEETRDIERIVLGAWANTSRLALWALATDERTPAELRAEARGRLLAAAELVRKGVDKADGYRCASSVDDYFWASNSNLMEKVHLLMMAARLAAASDQAVLIDAARDQWHWILGRNPNGYSMVTGVGKGPDRIYHMEWGPREPPPPGYLIDGPNSKNAGWLAPGAPAKALLWDNPKALRSGLAPHSLWHWRQSDLWDGGFVPEGSWEEGWWAVVEPDILYSANFVLAGATLL
jgi:endoglucanase